MPRFQERFLRLIAQVAIVIACVLSLSTNVNADQPNVVWLISEDNSKHFLKLFDESGADAPHIEALATEGLTFHRAFSNAPVCSVARTTLMTGCYGPRIGTQYHRRSIVVPMPGELRMFPYYLREAGYYTTNRDKKDYNAVEGEGVWDESSRAATWRHREAGQPFFHMQTFKVTHESSLHFPAEQMEIETQTDPAEVFLSPRHPDTPTFRYTYARYHDRIQEVDRQIGEVVDQLEEDGLLEDTFVFYFGDHGGVLPGSKGYAYEVGLHVPLVVRIPENYRSSVEVTADDTKEAVVSFIDFGPTVLHLAGISVPEEMDGQPFLGRGIDAGAMSDREVTYGYADRFDEKYDFVRTMRRGDLKYIRNFQPFNVDGLQNNYRYLMLAYEEWRTLHAAGELTAVQSQFFRARAPEELYDLSADPYETNNLAHDPAFATALQEMRHSLTTWMITNHDLSMVPESVFVEEGASDPVEYGRSHAERIEKWMAIVNLQLLPWDEARPKLMETLSSDDSLDRYWALVAATSFVQASDFQMAEDQTVVNDDNPLAGLVSHLAASDTSLLNRVRAAEFLAHAKLEDPSAVMLGALAESQSEVEALEILNCVCLLRDIHSDFAFTVNASQLHEATRDSQNVKRRLAYLEQPYLEQP